MTDRIQAAQTDEELVRARWKSVEVGHGLIDQDEYGWWILIVGVGRMKPCETEAAAWTAAAEFTRQREEEIRQIKEEVRRIRRKIPWLDAERGWWNYWPPFTSTQAKLVDLVRDICSMNRTLARLQRDLTALLKGGGE